jgi:hypothetical protein
MKHDVTPGLQISVVVSYNDGNEPSVALQFTEVLDQTSDCQLLCSIELTQLRIQMVLAPSDEPRKWRTYLID